MTIATETVTFESLVAEYESSQHHRDIARALWNEYGGRLFEMLEEEWTIALLADRIRKLRGNKRHAAIDVTIESEGNPIGVCRVSVAGPEYWSAPWLVGDDWKETRDLTLADLGRLIAEYEMGIVFSRARVAFLDGARKLAIKHKAKKLGDLEKKGIDLPDAEIALENGK